MSMRAIVRYRVHAHHRASRFVAPVLSLALMLFASPALPEPPVPPVPLDPPSYHVPEPAGGATARSRAPAILGRWDVTVYEPSGRRPSWFELTEDERGLQLRYVGYYGAPQDVPRVQWGDGTLAFSINQPRGPWREFRGHFNGSFFEGTASSEDHHTVRWTAERVPALRPPAPVHWGKPIVLFNRRDLSGWRQRHADSAPSWFVIDSALVGFGGDDLVTTRRFRDFKLHIECNLPPKGDSGIHLRGRHEIQLLQDSDTTPPVEANGALYGFIAPSRSPSMSPDSIDVFDITVIGRRLTVMLNGETLIDDAEMPGITGDALDCDESRPGPIMLQGYMGMVRFHEILLTPAR